MIEVKPLVTTEMCHKDGWQFTVKKDESKAQFLEEECGLFRQMQKS